MSKSITLRKTFAVKAVAVFLTVCSGNLVSAAESNSRLQSWVKYTDTVLMAPERLITVNLVNKLTKTAGTVGTLCNSYLPESHVPNLISSASCLSDGLPQYISVVGEVSGSFMPYVHVYKGVKSFGTLLLDNSADSGEDMLNILNGYTSVVALSYPNMLTIGAHTLTTLACTIYGVCQNKPLLDMVKTNYYSVKSVFQDDFSIANDDSTYLTAHAKVDSGRLDGKFMVVAENLTTADLTYALGALEIRGNDDLKEILVDTYASRALIKLKGTWVQGKHDDFFASHTSPRLAHILEKAGESAVMRAVYKKFGRSGLNQLKESLPKEKEGSIAIKGGNTSYSNSYDIKILDKKFENPVYIGEEDDVFFDCVE